MASYFVDPVNGNDTNGGTNQLSAFLTFQKALNTAVAGDMVYLRHLNAIDETLSAGLTTANAGSSSGGEIRFYGVDSNWDISGEKYSVAGPGSIAKLLNIGHNYIKFKNIKFNGGGEAVGSTTSGDHHFDNVIFSGATGYGFNGSALSRTLLTNCLFENNGSYGLRTPNLDGILSFCTIRNNATGGIQGYTNSSYGWSVRNSIIHDNGTYGINCVYGWAIIENSVIDGHITCLYMGSNATRQSLVLGNRFTNYYVRGIYANAVAKIYPLFSHNYFQQIDGLSITNGDMNILLTAEGADTNMYGSADGYVDRANRNFNLTADAIMRRVPVILPS